MKAYITAPYTGKADFKKNSYSEIKDLAYLNLLDAIETAIRNCGLETFLPHRDINEWGKSPKEPQEVYEEVMKTMKACDVIIAYPESSTGARVDIGLAAMMKKKIIILINMKEEVSLTYLGLKAITDVEIIRFDDIFDLKEKLRNCLNIFVPHH